ncbi:MAG: MFS transporter [Pseudomonadota bacterium]
MTILIGAGAAVAMLVGKVPAALPDLQAELGLSLVQSGWVIAIFNLVAAASAVFLGTVSDQFGRLRVAIFGMVLAALSGIAGGFVDSGTALLVTRVFEGFGFLLTTTSMPGLILHAVSERHTKTSLALWGTYMPVGSGFMLALSGLILAHYDWRVLWWLTSVLILAVALPVYRVGGSLGEGARRPDVKPRLWQSLTHAVGLGPILLSVVFAFYAGQYLIVAGFLPLIFIELNGFTPSAAAAVAAFAVFSNAAGNLLSGWLHKRGVRSTTLILFGCAAMVLGGSIVLQDGVSSLLRTVAAGGLFIVTGLIPSSLFALIPDHAPDRSVIATVSGIIMQGAAMGQLVGPPIGAAIVAWTGAWHGASAVVLVCAVVCASCALLLRRIGPRGQIG